MTGIIFVVQGKLFVECGSDWVGFDSIAVSTGIRLKYAFLIGVADFGFEMIVVPIDVFVVYLLKL